MAAIHGPQQKPLTRDGNGSKATPTSVLARIRTLAGRSLRVKVVEHQRYRFLDTLEDAVRLGVLLHRLEIDIRTLDTILVCAEGIAKMEGILPLDAVYSRFDGRTTGLADGEGERLIRSHLKPLDEKREQVRDRGQECLHNKPDDAGITKAAAKEAFSRREYKKAKRIWLELLARSEAKGANDGATFYEEEIGRCDFELKNYEEARERFVCILGRTGRGNKQRVIRERIAKCDLRLGRPQPALEEFLRLRNEAHEARDQIGVMILTRYIGECYYGSGQYRRALESFTSDRETRMSSGDEQGGVICDRWMARCHYGLEEYDEALRIYESLFVWYRQRESTGLAREMRLKMAQCLFKQGKVAEAKVVFGQLQALYQAEGRSGKVERCRSWIAACDRED
ncbi:tetratricopeptide repeat protein [Candidatus Margulisiibacteriota bacterium]